MSTTRRASLGQLSPAEVDRFKQQWKVDGEPIAYVLWCDIMGWDDATRQLVYSMLNHSNSHTSGSAILGRQTSISSLTRLFQQKTQLHPDKECHDRRSDHLETLDDYLQMAPFYVELIKALRQESTRLKELSKQKAQTTTNKLQEQHVRHILSLINKIILKEDLLPEFTMTTIHQLLEQVDNDSPMYDPVLSGFIMTSQVLSGSPAKTGDKYIYFPAGSPLRQFIQKYRMEFTIWTLENLTGFFKEYLLYYAKEKAEAGREAWPTLDDRCEEVFHTFKQMVTSINVVRAALRLHEFSDTEIKVANKKLENICSDIKMGRIKPQQVKVATVMAAVPVLVPVVQTSLPPLANHNKWLEVASVAGAMILSLTVLAILIVTTHGAALPLIAFLGAKLSFGLLGGGAVAAEVVGSSVLGVTVATVAGALGWLAEKAIKSIRNSIWPTVVSPVLSNQPINSSAATIRSRLTTDRISEKVVNAAEQATKEAHRSLSSFRLQSPGYWTGFLTFIGGQSMRSRHRSTVDLAQYEQTSDRPQSLNPSGQ